jgi:plasmid stabilization system protein ParE
VTPGFIVRPAAEAEIAEAALWYESRSLGLGAEFLRAVDVCFSEIQRNPDRFPEVYRQARKALLRRFPYAAYFVSTRTGISVVACMHVKRDPRRWQRRVDR